MVQPAARRRALAQPQPHAQRGRVVVLIQLLSGVLAVLVLLAISALARYEHRDELDDAGERGELMARVLDDHVTQTIE